MEQLSFSFYQPALPVFEILRIDPSFQVFTFCLDGRVYSIPLADLQSLIKAHVQPEPAE